MLTLLFKLINLSPWCWSGTVGRTTGISKPDVSKTGVIETSKMSGF